MQTKYMLIVVSLTLTLTGCFSSEEESTFERNVIKDKIYNDQFNAINKAQQVEGVLLDAAQSRREELEQQTN